MKGSRLAERLAKQIEWRIVGGEFAPRTHLSAQTLADMFEVSRSPIREALERLEANGLVKRAENRGYFVSSLENVQQVSQDIVEHVDIPRPYLQFSEDWLNDEIPAEVTEQFLRTRYGLTKSALDDILARAINDGWVEPKPGYGWKLLSVAKTTGALAQIYRFRATIEPAALLEPTFMFDRRKADELRESQQVWMLNSYKVSADRLITIGASFHEELAKMSNNPFYEQALTRVNRMRRLLDYRTAVDRARFRNQALEHIQMLDLLEKGDNLACSHMMRQHVMGALALKSEAYTKSAPISTNVD